MPLTSQIKKITYDGVYAYISVSAPTTCTLADTYYYLQGTFNNEIIKCWVVSPPLTYLGECGTSNTFEIDINASFESDTANNLITLAIYKNGILQVNSEMSIYIKNVSEHYSVSTVDVMHFSINDYIEIYVKASQAGSEVTANKLTTSLQRFYR